MTEHEIDRILSGEPVGDEAGDRLVSFARNMKATLAEPVPELLAARHLRAIFSVAGRKRTSERWSLVGFLPRAAAAVAAAALALAGALGAGSLPGVDGAAREGVFRALSHVGNSQDGSPGALDPESNSSDTAKAVLSVIAQRDSFASGCEFGHAVAAAASGETKGECPDKSEDTATTEENGPPEEHPGQGDPQGPPEEFPGRGKAKGQQEEFPGRGNATGHQQETSGKAKGHGEHPGQGRGKGQGGQSG